MTMMIPVEGTEGADDPPMCVSDYHRQYRVLRQIANGAFGSVHCVQRRDTKVIHAAKYVKCCHSDVEREVHALRSLSKSRLILQFVGFYTQEKNGIQSVLVTEFLAGGDLFERTSASDYVLTEYKCRTIVRQILRGVQFMHSKNFIHLDLKPFNVVFSKKKDDFDLRIIDFGLAKDLGDHSKIKIGMCGTIEYMSPEVMNCSYASPQSDMWGVGVIAYMLVSGGLSPFFAINRFRTMARVIDCDYSLDVPELNKVSDEAKSFISGLLVKNPSNRLNGDQALSHIWLRDDNLYLGIIETLETTWMRRCLARRRWYRLMNAVRVMRSIKSLKSSSSNCLPSTPTRLLSTPKSRRRNGSSNKSSVDSSIDDDDELDEDEEEAKSYHFAKSLMPKGLPMHRISNYRQTFLKLHLIVNNGSFGTIFCVQHSIRSNEIYASKEVRHSLESVRREANILHQLRNCNKILTLYGLYEKISRNLSVLVTDYLTGGDLVERTSESDFVLNESKCKTIVKQICVGLEFVHFSRILHMDLKPFSVFFVSKENNVEVKIADFCLAKKISSTDGRIKIDSLCGSLEFISPEVLECSYASYATDMWGVGIIAYMLLTGGKSPFWGGNRFRTMAKILAGQFDDVSLKSSKFISQNAKDFIYDLLLIDPYERISAAACLEHPWLNSDSDCVDTLQTLETIWMKQILARRRWQRWFNAVRATTRIRKFSSTLGNDDDDFVF
ncbi:ribosomal protein S6 kinase alpha-3 isoform X2 [Lepeophtheirus salmonis]|uniref:ribosomal protein S6 kinase alpha-3 isoform X2 n=1 Tax=Lepeophtheirus salmonis TaxID=72036 RepID=UPI001AE6FDC0|nr:myosin light chain kinase 3-like isoform X2 [Lepeophtheirus salmonis]